MYAVCTRFLFFRRPLLNRLSRRTGVPLRIRPLRHRRQSAQEQQQPRQRMDVRLPQRPDRRYRHLQYDSYDPLAQVHNRINEEGERRQQTHYFNCDQIGIPREMTDKDGNLVCGEEAIFITILKMYKLE